MIASKLAVAQVWYSTKVLVGCIICLKTHAPLREALKIYSDNGGETLQMSEVFKVARPLQSSDLQLF